MNNRFQQIRKMMINQKKHLEILRKKRIQIQKEQQRRLQQKVNEQFFIQQTYIPLQSNEPMNENLQRKLLNDERFIQSLPVTQQSIQQKPIQQKIITRPTPKINKYLPIMNIDPSFQYFPLYPSIPKHQFHISNIQIYGPFNTGTNLLHHFLQKLFQIQLFNDGSSRKWKHTLSIENIHNYFHIVILKNPFSWFQSMIKAEYNLMFQKNKPILLQQVTMKKTNSWLSGDPYQKTFISIAKLWFYYYQMYMNFAIKHTNCIFITYEDLLYSPDSLLQTLSNILKKPLPNQYHYIKQNIFQKPAKNRNQCSNVIKAIEKNKIDYLFSKYSKQEVEKFFQDVPLHLIHPYHKSLWNFDKWIQHFSINLPTDSNAPSIQP
jgi:hypothetical protein